jgi:hypothetical protein
MRHLSAIALVVLLVVLPSCKFFKNRGLFNKKSKSLIELQAQQDSIRVADSIRKVQDELLAIENARLESERIATEEILVNENRSRYNIVVGSFITPEYAREYAEEYKVLGYNPSIIKMDGTNFELVSAEAHENFNTAVARLRQFQDTVQIEAWIYIKQ